MRKLFGTDGIRGVANQYPLTVEMCFKLATALSERFKSNQNNQMSVIIGKDTRISGDMLESALAASFSSLGIKVFLIGICPTPAVSVITKIVKANFGIMVSASHNPFYDNGIKIFNNQGLKLTDSEEEEIEALIEKNDYHKNVKNEEIKSIEYYPQILDLYLKKITEPFAFNKEQTKNIKIVVDSSNGSFSKIAPKILKDFGFDVVSIYDSPNGININEKCGVTNPNTLASETVKNKADIGIAFDGDGDRLLLCDESGRFLNGEHILAALAKHFNLKDFSEIVSTIMANFGFEKYLENQNIKLIRTKVGDRYISEYMRENEQAIIGGEPSGHIIIKEHSLTGDGLFAALSVLSYLIENNKKASELYDSFELFPCVSRNVKVINKNVIDNESVAEKIKFFSDQLNKRGKLIVRPSGTEPIIRISAEGENKDELENIVNSLDNLITESDKK